MTKIRLNNTHRDILRQYGQEKIASLIDRSKERELYQTLLDGANKAIREKYPQEDMQILQKYNLARQDRCLRFQFPSGRVDGFYFDPEDTDKLADVPKNGGCYSSDVFPVDAAFEEAYDSHAEVRKQNNVEHHQKGAAFRALIDAAKTLEDVLQAIELPSDLQERLGKKCTALVALSPDVLKNLKHDFAISPSYPIEQAVAKARKESAQAAA